MKATIAERYKQENLADKVIGEYRGNGKYTKGNIQLRNDSGNYADYVRQSEIVVQITRISNYEVVISFHSPSFPDFVFNNNVLNKDDASSKILIEGDWITGWGIIGWLGMTNRKLVIDINPVHYTKTPNSGINPESLVNRYVMYEGGSPHHYKTVFNLEFEGVRQ